MRSQSSPARLAARAALVSAAALSGLLLTDGDAAACGCFTMPDPTVPVVQAGERIVFAINNGVVTAHIQISYQGDAKDFGWLLPLPSVPTLELGTDELFTLAQTATQPSYQLTTKFDPATCGNSFFPGGFGGGGGLDLGVAPSDMGRGGGPSPLVIQASIGPYDYAVLKADNKDAMLQWLMDNRYVVPAGTDGSITNYIAPGAYFLALKLAPAASTGDLQPIVVHYASDLPMIPITLTSVGAVDDMGIQAFVLGKSRAISRNYLNTVLDDAAIDWATGGRNYRDVVIKATKEAPGRHTFVTEYAAPTTTLQNKLDAPQRFGDPATFRAITDPAQYVSTMLRTGYPENGVVVAVLSKYIPFPSQLADMGVTAAQYYFSLDYYLGTFRNMNPDVFTGLDFTLNAGALTDELQQRVVTPTLAAGALLKQNPRVTRFYGTLSPAQMNADPVFSFNPELPDVSNIHQGELTFYCTTTMGYTQVSRGVLRTEQGYVLTTDASGNTTPPADLPYSKLIETLRESGSPGIATDNSALIQDKLGAPPGMVLTDGGVMPAPPSGIGGGAGCSVPAGDRPGSGTGVLVGAGVLLLLAVSRRRRG